MPTLGQYRGLALLLSGDENSTAVKFFDAKIAEQGADMEVIADDVQMILLLQALLKQQEGDE